MVSCVVVVVVVTQTLPRNGCMAENHGAPEALQFSKAWTRGRKERESPKNERCKESVAGSAE